jgi:PKD repeat protein
MNRSYEDLKVDIGLLPQSIASTNVTGKYYSMKEYREALAILTVGNITAAGTAALQIMEAKTEAAGSAQALTSRVATIAANVKVASLSITCVGGEADDKLIITVGGVAYTFTGKAAEDLDAQEWDASGDDTADATSIKNCVNATLAGKITATSNLGVVTLVADDGYYIESISETGAFTTFATLSAQGYVWLDSMDLTALYGWISCKVTTAGNTGICNAVLIRGKSKGAITQRMGANYPA